MTMLLIMLIIGAVYFMKRPRLSRVAATDYPDVPAEQFHEWKRLELASIDILLWATWGLAVIGTIVVVLVASLSPDNEVPAMVILITYLVLFLLGVVVSAIKGSKAVKLKKSLGIKWPLK